MENGDVVRMTARHNVYVREHGALEEEGVVEKVAGDVRVGMWVWASSMTSSSAPSTGHMLKKDLVRVIDIQRSIGTGFFAPITTAGTIVIDGAIVSCYARRSSSFRHAVMTPLIWLYQVMGIPGEGELPGEIKDHFYSKWTGRVLKATVGEEFGVIASSMEL